MDTNNPHEPRVEPQHLHLDTPSPLDTANAAVPGNVVPTGYDAAPLPPLEEPIAWHTAAAQEEADERERIAHIPSAPAVSPMGGGRIPVSEGGTHSAASQADDKAVEQAIHRLSRRSFLWGAAAVAGTYGLWRGINAQRTIDGLGWPFRLALQANENLARDYFKTTRLAPTFTKQQIGRLPLNGIYGADPEDDFEAADWKLHVVGLKEAGDEEGGRTFTLADIKKLPRVEMITELKCIEGWSSVVQWAGARLADFIAHYPPELIDEAAPQYVGMKTPDEAYYVGLDMESALHPQTLLCYEMNGKPLTYEHGAPLRLVIPVKYGIKNIKRIGTITFTNDRPKDYWAEQGYDWYAGH